MFSQQIKNKALKIGFSACGVIRAESLQEEKENIFRQWLQNGFHADMNYLQRNLDKRMHPQLLLEGTKSIIVVLLNYHHPVYQKPSTYTVAQYALGCDYHAAMKNKLHQLSDFILLHYPKSCNRYFTDTAPVLEKHLAYKAGLGSIGKNTLLITAKGSYFFIGEIYTTLPLQYDSPYSQEYCSQCDQCLKACPVHALESPYRLNANKCISYHTIENKNNIPTEIQSKMGKQIYGCDICQQVCPVNKHAEATEINEFSIKPELLQWNDDDWKNLDKNTFEKVFSDSVFLRIGYNKLMQTVKMVQGRKV
jgi:epoxyqueuosine reductase